MNCRIVLSGLFLVCSAMDALAGPTGLNVIPTTDIVPPNSWIGGFANGNTSLSGMPFYRMPLITAQSQFGLAPWLEAGFDYSQTADMAHDAAVFNVKALVFSEDEKRPNVALGLENVTMGQVPSTYITVSKTLNYAQQMEERFKAHHRRNRKLLGQRVHVGMTLGHKIAQPFAGTDLQLSESIVFQADWVRGPGNAATAGLAFVLPDQRSVVNPSILYFNDTGRFGFSFNFSHQFSF